MTEEQLLIRLMTSRAPIPRGKVDLIDYALSLSIITDAERAAFLGEQFVRPQCSLSVGFVQSALTRVGGIETWLRTIVPRLRQVTVVGAVASHSIGPIYTDGIACVVGHGIRSAVSLCDASDVIVVSNEPRLDAILKRCKRRPAIVYVHHGDEHCVYSKSFIEQQAEWIDVLACVNPQAATEFSGRFPVVEHVRNAPDPSRAMPNRSRESMRAEIGIRNDDIVILYSGRFSQEKGFEKVREIARLLPKGFVLVAMGGDVTRSDIQQMRCVGQQVHPGNWYHAADIAISPSINEGSGLSMLEIALAGLPLVATRKGIIVEYPELARVVEDDVSATQWLNTIVSDLSNPSEQARRCDQAYEIVTRNYPVNSFARDWENLIVKAATLPTLRRAM